MANRKKSEAEVSTEVETNVDAEVSVESEEDKFTYLKTISDATISGLLSDILDGSSSDMSLKEALNKFEDAINTPYCRRSVQGDEEKKNYGINTVRRHLKSKTGFAAKETVPVSIIIRNLGGIEKNYANVTEETRDYKDKNLRVGLAGPWRRCPICTSVFNSEVTGKTSCPDCLNETTKVLADQAVPEGTKGIVNRKFKTMGDISSFNARQAAAFVFNEKTSLWEPCMIKFVGKARSLLSKVILGKPFVINVDANVFFNEDTGIKYYTTTGTSAVSNFKGVVPDVISIYEQHEALLKSLDNIADGDFAAMVLQVLGKPEKKKDDGKYLVQLSAPGLEEEENPDAEPIVLSMFLDDERVARQLKEGDAGIFEVRYSESTISSGDTTTKQRVVNVDVTPSGIAIYLFGEESGTRFIHL